MENHFVISGGSEAIKADFLPSSTLVVIAVLRVAAALSNADVN